MGAETVALPKPYTRHSNGWQSAEPVDLIQPDSLPILLTSAADLISIHAASALPPPQPTPATKPEPETEGRDVIRRLLQYQSFDGGFEWGAVSVLGHDIMSVISTYPDMWNGNWQDWVTLAILVLLERDFGSCESLWAMMRLKALQFLFQRWNISTHGPIWCIPSWILMRDAFPDTSRQCPDSSETSCWQFMGIVLAGLQIPMHLDGEDGGEGGVTESGSARELVEHAPVD
ncbi:hypothetical protein QBC47DRAFT_366971, partial [Echria macrotheca]